MRAVVMAGGLGSRLRPLTTSLPKPLLPVVGQPMLAHILRLAHSHGVDEVTLTVQHLASVVRAYLGDGSDLGLTVSYATEHRPLGTAGGVRAAAIDFDDDFLVMSGDAVTDIDLTALMHHHRETGALMTLCLARRDDPREFGLVDVDDDGRVRRFVEKPGWGEVFTDAVSTGIYAISPRVVGMIPDDGPQDWSSDILPSMLTRGLHVGAFVSGGYWEDVGDIAAYRRVQVDVLERKVNLPIPGTEREPGVWVGDGVTIDPEAIVAGPTFIGAHSAIEAGATVLAHSVVGANAVIRRGAIVERAVLLDGVYAGVDASLRGCVVGRSVEVGAGSRAGEGAVIADDCSLEQEVDVTPGSLIYPGKTVEAGTIVHGSVVWDAQGQRRRIGAGGISGTVSVDITPDTAVRLASALASTLPKDGIVAVGRDHSRTARAYAGLLVGAFTAAGLDARDHRVVPAPVLRHDVLRHASAGVMVRAWVGHPERIDIVLLDDEGGDISESEARRIERTFERREFRRPFPGEVGDVIIPEQALDDYAMSVRSRVSLDGVSSADLTVVVDASGGSSALVLPTVLAGVDVDLVMLGGRIEVARATPSNADRHASLSLLAERVVATNASMGLAIDSTGERLSLVDELGQVLDDDRSLLVVMDLVAAESRHGHVVLPVTASRVAEQVADFHGIEVRRVPVARTFIGAESGEPDALMRSDGQGGFAIGGTGGQRDAIATAIALLGLVARTQLTLSAIDARVPRTVSVRHAVPTPWAAKASVMRAVQEQAGGRPLDVTDGVRVIEHDGSWCLVLPDDQEPLTRLWVEAPTYARAMQVAEEWVGLIERMAGAAASG
ncbi:MAG: sugar phosphate nucleotidyltransferase [Ilumatobacteraceae bacterium]